MDAKTHIEWVLKAEKLEYEKEYKFLYGRKFRADYYVPKYNLLIEYEGLMSKKSRHTTVCGFNNDCTKYNLAQLSGYKLLRYTALNYKDLTQHLNMLRNAD